MANITTTEYAGFIPEIWAASALGYLKMNTVMARLVNRNYESAFGGVGDILNVPRRGTLSVNAKAANTAVTLQTPTADTIALTLNHHEEVSFIVEDIAKAQANQDGIMGYIQDGIAKIAEKVDTDILALYSGFSTTPIDATGGPDPTGTAGVRSASVIEANRLLDVAKAPNMNRYIVWHPDAIAEMLDNQRFISTDFGDDGSAVREAVLGRKFGFTHFMSQNVPVADGEAKNLAFHTDAIMFATRPLPPPPPNTGAQAVTMAEDGFSIRVLYAYNPTYLGLQVTLDILYGVAELRDAFGVVVRSTDY